MKILFIIPGEESGNSMIFAKRQINSLQNLGVTAFTFYLRSRLNPVKLFTEYLRFRKCLKSFNPQIIHCHYGTMTAFFAAYSNLKPLVITFHGSDLNFVKKENFFLEVFRKLLSQLAALRASAIICVSERLREKLFWKKPVAAVIPMGIDEDFFKPINYSEARKKLNFEPDKKIILFNYNNTLTKRLDIAQQTEAIVQKQIASAQLKILNGKVSPDEIILLLNASDCLLLCSDTEGSPMMVKEAMACNLPVVSNDVGDVKQNIEGTIPGIVTKQDAKLLAEGIVQVLKMNARSNGRERLEPLELTEKTVSEKILNLYRKILKP